jgi:hypothetical protein
MQYYLEVRAFTMLGAVHLAATVRSDTPTGAIERVRALSTDVPDCGTDDPDVFARDALVALLELL